MPEFKVNGFTIIVGNPYPVLTTIEHGGIKLTGIKHDELRDLHYAVEKAMKIAKIKLRADSEEV